MYTYNHACEARPGVGLPRARVPQGHAYLLQISIKQKYKQYIYIYIYYTK